MSLVKLKKNEKPHETATRELKEETGLTPISMWTVDRVNHFFEAEQNRMNLIPVFGVEVESSIITLSPKNRKN